MDNNKLNQSLNDILLGKFLVNFVPGIILFFVLTTFIEVRFGEGLIAFTIVTCVSWTLGVILEFIFFRKRFLQRWKGQTPTALENITLLIGKTGIAILTACIFRIDLEWILDLFDERNENEMYVINLVVKLVLFAVGGILLYLFYRKQEKSNQES